METVSRKLPYCSGYVFLAAPCILFVAMTEQRRVSNSYSDVIVLLCAQSHRDNTRNPAKSWLRVRGIAGPSRRTWRPINHPATCKTPATRRRYNISVYDPSRQRCAGFHLSRPSAVRAVGKREVTWHHLTLEKLACKRRKRPVNVLTTFLNKL